MIFSKTEIVLKTADCEIFEKLLAIAGKRNLDLKEILKYELSTVCLSI